MSIEIITQPGLGPVRYNTNFRFRDDALSGRSPFVPARGPEQNLNYGFGLGGTLVKDKSSFNLNVFGINSYDTPNLNAALANGTQALALGLRSPRDNLFVNGQVDYALTLDQTLRFAYNLRDSPTATSASAATTKPERAYSNENNVHNLRGQHYRTDRPPGVPAVAGPVVLVGLEQPVGHGGAHDSGERCLHQRRGAACPAGEHSRTVNLGADLDYVRGRHSLRAGVALDGGWYRSDASSNYLGTYTFDSLEAFLAQRPSNYTRRLGDPNISYRNFQAGCTCRTTFA